MRPPIRPPAAWLPVALTGACLLLLGGLVPGSDVRAADPVGGPPPCADRDPLRRAFFGDLHVHTTYSLDASTQDTRTRPAEAYRFARGERLGIQPFDRQGTPLRSVRLERPLDFAAVTDHAELLGEWNICNHEGLPGHDSIVCRVYRRWPRLAFFWMNGTVSDGRRHDFCGEDGARCVEAARGPWDDIRAAAAAANDRCHFTSFVAYEWTGTAGTGNNLHRNVIFANDQVPPLPISFVETLSPPRLWRRLREECTEAGTGCDVVVIPHNPNLGGGKMFRTVREDGRPIDAAEARARAELETLVEVMQHKGDSECHPGLGSEDELCGFEKLTMASFTGRYVSFLAEPPTARQFVREVLKEGLRQEARLGINPFRFGLIGSTDTHLGTPGLVAESADYPGHGGAGKPAGDEGPAGLPDAIDLNPGGLAVLWAEENTREALFAALKRREAYGTSGPRLTLRFFGGWDHLDDLCERGDLVRAGYAGGVPMGGTLTRSAEASAAPRFAVSVLRDPGADGAPLQRLQIVKGWLEGATPREAVVDVAGDAGRGDLDPSTCTVPEDGFDSLCAVWRDPDFDPGQRAFYYARAVEVPTCRWSQKLCLARGVRCDDPDTIGPGLDACCAPDHVRTVQERAWSSPIWYAP
jgi:hypothetical protein